MRALVTGSAGFIGYHVADHLLSEGWSVVGYDGITDYYDVGLKRARHANLKRSARFVEKLGRLEDRIAIEDAVAFSKADVVIHLAAQAGVRQSLENPRAYLESNVVGTFNLLEALRVYPPSHLLLASSSSVYGDNKGNPSRESDCTDFPMSFYAATKKTNEVMSYSWARTSATPTTAMRFFTVYGPWGRPDMAIGRFAAAILNGSAIDIYNNGNMVRDFTYVADVVKSIRLLIDHPPGSARLASNASDNMDGTPYRIVNIGNSRSVTLMQFIEALENSLGRKASRRYLPMQQGDVLSTCADTSKLKQITGFAPSTSIEHGLMEYARWHSAYYVVGT